MREIVMDYAKDKKIKQNDEIKREAREYLGDELVKRLGK